METHIRLFIVAIALLVGLIAAMGTAWLTMNSGAKAGLAIVSAGGAFAAGLSLVLYVADYIVPRA